MSRIYQTIVAAWLLLTLSHLSSTVLAQGTAFTYQGQLQNNGSLAGGTYNLQFTLYTNATGGTVVGGPITSSAVHVTSNGLFTVTIDFGGSVWNGETNWLQIAVETNGGASFTTLSPLQQLTPVPYAITAESVNGTVSASSLSGTYVNAVVFSNANNSFSGSFSGNGAGLTSLRTTNLVGVITANQLAPNIGVWTLNGSNLVYNAGNVGIGTTNPAMPLVVMGLAGTNSSQIAGAIQGIQTSGGINGSGVYGLSLVPNGNGVIGEADTTTNNEPGDFPAGVSGYSAATNGVALYALASAPSGQTYGVEADDYSPNGYAGYFSGRSYFSGNVGIGTANPGEALQVQGNVIIGGPSNTISSGALYSMIAGGGIDEPNTIGSTSCFIGAGDSNTISSGLLDSFIGAGYDNNQAAADAFIGSGVENGIQVNSSDSFIGGGDGNMIDSDAPYSTIGGGLYNQIYGDTNYYGTSVIAGGYNDIIYSNSWNSFIGGGGLNSVDISSDHSVVVGGFENTVQGGAEYGTIGGGAQNSADAYAATVPGGNLNSASGVASFAAGQHAQALNNGAFVWSDDSSATAFSSTANNQFNVRAMGGVRLVTGGTGMTLDGQSVVPSGNYVFAYSSNPQIVTPGNFQNITFTAEPQLSGWGANNSQFICPQTGVYLIQYNAEAVVSDSLSIHVIVNSTEIPGSQAYASSTSFGTVTGISKTFLANVISGSILSVQYTGNSGNDSLQGGGSGTVEPSISLTITRIQ